MYGGFRQAYEETGVVDGIVMPTSEKCSGD